MSSLSATQADGYYVPPEYYNSGQYKKKSKNQFVNSKGHNQFEQRNVVRFELPYDGFCLNRDCQQPIGKGTRYNATKAKHGNYLSTPIYQFQMTCRACQKQQFIIRTNPKEFSFDYVSGIHRQVKEFDTHDAGTLGIIDTDDNNRITKIDNGGRESDTGTSNISKLETIVTNKRKIMSEHDQLETLIKINDRTFNDDAYTNSLVRKSFRIERNKKKSRLKSGKQLGWKEGMELLDHDDNKSSNDYNEESKRRIRKQQKLSHGMEKDSFRKLRASSIFSSSTSGKSATTSSKRRRKRHGSSIGRIHAGAAEEKKAKATKVKIEEDYNDSSTRTNNGKNMTHIAGHNKQESDPPILLNSLRSAVAKQEHSSDHHRATKLTPSATLKPLRQSRHEDITKPDIATSALNNDAAASAPPFSSSLNALACCYESSSSDDER